MNTQQLQTTFRASIYAEQIYQKYQHELEQDVHKYNYQEGLSDVEIQQLVKNTVADIDGEHQFMRALRILRARLMFRWIYQDANRLTDVLTLTRELSDFADECVRVTKDFAYQPLIKKYGEPIGEQGEVQDLIVIAMGKHGAKELNLSSDIDLIFAFDENGETNGRKCIDVQQFCILWGQKLIYLLDHITADGFVFRVDMRLRPWGDGSALALSYHALEKYLSQHGREWERYAWIKARLVTGGMQGELLMQMTRPFVYRRYVDYSAFEAMREMKNMIEREVQRRNITDDIKLGAGGIREIEFIVQVFQLLYGGAKTQLQERQCLVNLRHLAELELLDRETVTDLSDAYLYLRRVEHAIQALYDQQTQSLPSEPELQQRMIETLGYSSWQDFMDVLDEKRNKVKAQFKILIQDTSYYQQEQQQDNDSHKQLLAILDDDTRQRIERFWHSSYLEKLPAKSMERLKNFWSLFTHTLLQCEQPQHALLNLMPLVESIVRRSVYLVMLVESKGALQRLVKMATASSWICEELAQYPVLLDEFLSMDFTLPTRQYLQDSLRQQLLRIEIGHVEDYMRILRLFKKSNVLAVASSDVLAESHLMRVSDALTDIAEVSIQSVLQFAYQMVAQRHGYPCDLNGQRCSAQHLSFAVIAYGKLGGIELGYSSDLDLVFIHHLDEQSETDGQKTISGLQFATRVVQKFISLMTTQTLDGRIYEIDTRLRPSGDAGMLVCSLYAFEQYQRKNAWVWEHQALVRARSVAGDDDLRQIFEKIRLEILTLKRDEDIVREEVIKMRQKMKEHLGSSPRAQQQGIFHLKHDTGGIVDIEFIAQFAVLAWSHDYPQIAHYSDNVRILQDVIQAGKLSEQDGEHLTRAYLVARAESHRLALANRSLKVKAEDWQDVRDLVSHLWQNMLGCVKHS